MPAAEFAEIADPEVVLAIAYAPAAAQPALRAICAFDARLAAILRSTTEPMLGQLRLTWWHDAVSAPTPIAGEPVLAALAAQQVPVLPLQHVIEGWEALLDDPDEPALTAYAQGRAGAFTAAAQVLHAADPVADAGAGWALVDLARHHSRPDVAARALALAAPRLAAAPKRWSRAGRPLGILTKLARRDLAGVERQGSPRRLLAAVRLALTGR